MKRNCQEIEFLLDAYHDGELSPEKRGVVDQHLSSCPNCSNSLDRTTLLCSTLSQLPQVVPSSRLDSCLDAVLQKQYQPNTWHSPLWVSFAAAAIVLGLFSYKMTQPQWVDNNHIALVDRATIESSSPSDIVDVDEGAALLADADNGTNGENVGIATDEDGLYALKL